MQQPANKERIILGIDPGTTVLGYGIIKETGRMLSLVSLGVVKLDHLDDHGLKLQRIFQKTSNLIEQYQPDCVALEAPFYGKNIQVMLKLGRAQGVAMAAALNKDIPIFEYAPRKIKQSVTGNGNAAKEQVAAMLKTLLRFEETPQFLDATDGLAVAVCHAFQNRPSTSKKGNYSSWEAFVRNNADRLK
ncbi:crossover junction endodeoxyribonuclease RuvC [Parapedobacter sp. ISTM3]|uniref:Crossover junction endodeoxyribonuclease RuvC n=1 Tax=Parapedobacter luteus TaxID=623280 RepID=A0A1T5BU44_9SPHI|nr:MULTISPECIES: crossover junction endodeoxyribonuclease RuvC [Parapedobacter]MBK1439771.1 crossover junction endodeoxyribonuclease RuvC [Parapedobacter sp. ISTM3]SKB50410.1 Holliday junction endonuclease RuvC [Parapedobacter luteus]